MDAQKHLFDNKKMAALLIPLAIDQLLNSFMGTVDTLVVSNLGSAAISAVTLVDSINTMLPNATWLHKILQIQRINIFQKTIFSPRGKSALF